MPFLAFSGVIAVALAITENPLWLVAWLVYWAIGLGGWRLWAELDRHSTVGFGGIDAGWGAALNVLIWPLALIMTGGEVLVRSFLHAVIPEDEEDDGSA